MMDGEGETGGTLYVVGIGPGLPAHLTKAARSTIHNADAVYVASLYQSFLRSGGILPDPESTNGGPEVIESTRGSQATQARESFERVRSGEDVVHVSGGDPNVYGKADLVFSVAQAEGYTDIDFEVIPGVTAALGGSAVLGAPLANDFATISLSDSWRDWSDIERKLRGASEAGFVLVLYNGWRKLEAALDTIREGRPDDVPVAILEDIARGQEGRNPGGESVTISTLGSVIADWDGGGSPGMLALIGSTETTVLDTGDTQFLVTPRGELDLEEI